MEVLRIRDALQDRKDLRRTNPISVLASPGNTPLVQICRMTRHLRGGQVFARAEWLNPGGSGDLARGKIILDSTSGNTRIAYAMRGAIKGYPFEWVVPGGRGWI